MSLCIWFSQTDFKMELIVTFVMWTAFELISFAIFTDKPKEKNGTKDKN